MQAADFPTVVGLLDLANGQQAVMDCRVHGSSLAIAVQQTSGATLGAASESMPRC